MNPGRWEQVEHLCHEALALQPAERDAFLGEACGDDADLRREVESLIAEQSSAAAFLEGPPIAGRPAIPSAWPENPGALSAGARLGPYEITARIGAGGMGEVYKARDTRLGRTVAIKVLPPGLAADPERRRRFEQEARAVSALNHPHICTLHDVGSVSADGGAGAVEYLVMEYVEGETLADRLGKGRLPVAQALEYGGQIADALGRAHRQGIVHRDLKPANIMLTRTGIKLLDFGLAKLKPMPAAGATGRLSGLATREPTTTPGLVLGTVPYMAPEQLEGKETDARTDLFALGCVLYEMLTGRRAFAGESEASIISAIMSSQPPPVSALLPLTPPALDRLVRRCLEKDPDQRAESANDLAFELRSIASGGELLRPSATSRRRRALLPVSLMILLAGLVFGALFPAWHRGAAQPDMHRLTYRRGTVRTARFMPDGQTILYGAAWDGDPFEVFATRFDSSESRAYGFRNAEVFAVSPTGDLALMLNPGPGSLQHERGTLATVGTGGSPRPLSESIVDADWAPNGTDLAAVRILKTGARVLEFPLNKRIYEGSEPVRVRYDVDATVEYMPREVRVSPRGGLLAVIECSADPDFGHVVVVDASGATKLKSENFTNIMGLAWSPDGREVWFTGAPHGGRRALYALDLSGQLRLVLRVPGHLTLKDISRDGRVLIARDDTTYGIRGLAPGGSAERDLTWYSWSLLDGLSADGNTLLFSEGGEAFEDRWGTYIRRTDGSPAVRLGDGLSDALSDDGKWVIAGSQWNADRPGESYIVLLPTGPGQPRRLTAAGNHVGAAAFLPGGNAIVYIGREGDRPRRDYYLPLDAQTATPITPEGVWGLNPTPDGQYVLAARSEKWLLARGNTRTHALYPVHGGPEIPLHDFSGVILGWHDDGKRLRVVEPGEPCKVVLVDPFTGKTEPWKEFRTSLDRAGLRSGGCPTAFSADGTSYAYQYRRELSELYVIEGLR